MELSKVRNSDRKCNYKCGQCGKTYFYEHRYEQHITAHDGLNNSRRDDHKYSRETQYKCDKCGKTFKLKCDYERHIINTHFHGRYQCKICGKRYKLQPYFQAHIQMHEKDSSNTCPVCGAIFQYSEHLSQHVTMHTDKIKGPTVVHFVCDICNEPFPSQTKVTKHKTEHHSNSYYPCVFCKKIFQSKHLLTLHKMSNHEKITPDQPSVTDQNRQPAGKCEDLVRYSARQQTLKHRPSILQRKPYVRNSKTNTFCKKNSPLNLLTCQLPSFPVGNTISLSSLSTSTDTISLSSLSTSTDTISLSSLSTSTDLAKTKQNSLLQQSQISATVSAIDTTPKTVSDRITFGEETTSTIASAASKDKKSSDSISEAPNTHIRKTGSGFKPEVYNHSKHQNLAATNHSFNVPQTGKIPSVIKQSSDDAGTDMKESVKYHSSKPELSQIYQCCLCGIHFTVPELRLHLGLHTGEFIHCRKCQEYFHNNKKFKEHECFCVVN